VISFILILLAYPQIFTWINFKNILPVFILQFFIYTSLMSIISIRSVEQLYENNKIKLFKVLTFFNQSKQNITESQLNEGKNQLKLSKLLLSHKYNFAIIFTRWMIESNSDLNIIENYDLLYRELGIPVESIINNSS